MADRRHACGLSLSEMADAVDEDPDFRVLRRMAGPPAPTAPAIGLRRMVGCAVDTETTGLDPQRDRIIELAYRRFEYDARGEITSVWRGETYLEDPMVELDAKVVALTGLSNAMLGKKRIHEGPAGCALMTSDLIICHNASFDRPFLDSRLVLEECRWACSLKDVDWHGLGFEGGSLHHLLMQCGLFYEAHRALTDVDALLHLLAHRLPEGSTVLSVLIRNAALTTARITFRQVPKGKSGVLRRRGYRWRQYDATWSRDVPIGDADSEKAWGRAWVYGGRSSPAVRTITWSERYAADPEEACRG